MTRAPNRIAVVGAGGFAREVKWLIGDLGSAGADVEFAGFVVSDLSKLGEHDSRDEVRGDFDWVAANPRALTGLAIGIGHPTVRHRLGRELGGRFPELDFPPLVHPSVHLETASANLERGVLLCAGTIGTVNVTLREFSMVNLACTLGHEAEIGAGCVLNPTVNISGGVRLGERVLVGTGSQILQYVTVGDDSTVGAGALVNKDVDAGTTVVGVPAKPLAEA